MIASPLLWGRAQVAAELDGGADANKMLAARKPQIFAPEPLHPYYAVAVPALLAVAGAPAAVAAVAGAAMTAASTPATPGLSPAPACGTCVAKATGLAAQVATEQQVTGANVAAEIVPPPAASGIPVWWWIVLAVVIGYLLLSPSRR